MFWNKFLYAGYLASCLAEEINYQKIPNCGHPRKKASVNIFEKLEGDEWRSRRKRRSPEENSSFYLGNSAYSDDYGESYYYNDEDEQYYDDANEEYDYDNNDDDQSGDKKTWDGSATTRIVGGQTAQANSWPWQAHLSVCGKWYGILECNICGGSLINPKWIVSAAHCVPEDASGTIILGAHQISKGGTQRIPVKQFIVHDHWNDPKMFDNDLSLLELMEDAKITDEVSPICLSHPGTCFDEKTPCVVTGWGLTDERGGFPDDLQEVAVRLISPEVCKTYQGYDPTITENMLCAGFKDGSMDACAGDSGGPMVCSLPEGGWVLYGVVSWGYGCARPNSPGVYTRMTNMVEFINKITGLVPDPDLDFKGNCGSYDDNFEVNWKQDYQKLNNNTHIWGRPVSDIEWQNTKHQDNNQQQNQQTVESDTCNYSKTGTYGTNNYNNVDHDNGESFTIHTENYPQNYPNSQDCTWTITNSDKEKFISVTIAKGMKNECRDRLLVNSDSTKQYNLCKTKKSLVVLDPTRITLQWVSNGYNNKGKGFHATIQYRSLTFMCDGSDTIILRSAGAGRSASPTLLKSENYPKVYSSYSQCRWHITAEYGHTIGFFLKEFRTEKAGGRCSAQHDNFLVFEADDCQTETLKTAPVWGSICGIKPKNRLRYNTGLSNICVTFLADGDNRRGKGFLVQVNQIRKGSNSVVPSYNAAN